ncbi:MAG: hypothetical protein ACLGIO_04485 [Acidimicrobiia bacterium]
MTAADRAGAARPGSPEAAPPAPPAGAAGGLLAPVAAGVAIGIDALLAGLALVPVPQAVASELTENGMHNFRPERDSALYLGAGALAVVAAVLLSRTRRAPRMAPRPGRWARWAALGVPAMAAATSTAVFLAARHALPLGGAARFAYLALSVGLAGACVAAVRTSPAAGPARRPSATALDVPAGEIRPGPADAVVPALVAALLYVPGWREVAGGALAGEGALHLDFFALGPALAFDSGLALGSDVQPYYGVGWAMVVAGLDALSYGRFLRLEIVYGCVYFAGVYLLVRLLTGDRRWAAAGTGVAVLLQMFAAFPDDYVVWRFPSATVMRWPFDVWFFVACLMSLRSRRPAWGVLAGALVGLTLVFQTETAVALGVAFGFWSAARWRAEGAAAGRGLAAAVAAGVAVAAAGLWAASRGTLVSGRFWDGWLENVHLGARGATLLPIAGVTSAEVVVAFVAVAAAYLAFASFAVVRVVRGGAAPAIVLVGSLAVYGFVTFLYFVGRSHPHNLFRPTVPLAVLAATAGGLAWRAQAEARRSRRRRVAIVPWGAVVAVVAALVAAPGVRAYPGVLRTAVSGDGGPVGECLTTSPADVCGLPPAFGGTSAADLRSVAARLRALGSEGTPVAVVDLVGPVIPYLAGAKPWGRYWPLFPSLFTVDQRRAALVALDERPPPLLVMRTLSALDPLYDDSWHAFRPVVERGFSLDSRHGSFEVWTARPRSGGGR